MNDAALRSAILRALAQWGSLPETDLLLRLSPVLVVDFRPTLLHALQDEGLVTVRQVGDERVVKLTEQGRAATGGSQPL